MARPPSSDPKSEYVVLRMTVSEEAALNRAATRANMTKSAFVRNAVRRVVSADERKAAKLRGEV